MPIKKVCQVGIVSAVIRVSAIHILLCMMDILKQEKHVQFLAKEQQFKSWEFLPTISFDFHGHLNLCYYRAMNININKNYIWK